MDRSCCYCGTTRDTLMIDCIERASSPGRGIFGCPQHARTYARDPLSPPWLKDTIAALDAELTDTQERLPAGRSEVDRGAAPNNT